MWMSRPNSWNYSYPTSSQSRARRSSTARAAVSLPSTGGSQEEIHVRHPVQKQMDGEMERLPYPQSRRARVRDKVDRRYR